MTRYLLVLGAGALIAGFAVLSQSQSHAAGLKTTEFSSQQEQPRQRPRTRVRIYPEEQPAFWDYPRPGTYSWPGPNAKRDCKAWYVVENRATGPTLTPRMTCRWVPG